MKQQIRKLIRPIRRAYGRQVIKNNGFWFIDIPRTSSTSIRYELAQAFGSAYGKQNVTDAAYRTRQIFGDHVTAREMSNLLGPEVWNELYKFSVVRNPFARVFSMYHYRVKNEGLNTISFRDYVKRLDVPSNRDGFFPFPFYRYGASDFLTSADDVLDLNCIVKYENRTAELAQVGERIGLSTLGQTWVQEATPKQQHYSNFYDSPTRRIIEKLYRKDLDLFEYEFENG